MWGSYDCLGDRHTAKSQNQEKTIPSTDDTSWEILDCMTGTYYKPRTWYAWKIHGTEESWLLELQQQKNTDT